MTHSERPDPRPPSAQSAAARRSLQSSNRGAGDRDRLLKHAEAKLLGSPQYRKALDGFKEMFGDAAYAAQMMMHSVNREAMQLAIDTTLADRSTRQNRPSQAATQPLAARSAPAHPIAENAVPHSSTPSVSPSRRAAYLYRLGQYLRSQRRRQGFSLAQIHHLTRIPLPHLHALESGHVARFPQSRSYLHGSVRIWGNVLGLDGAKLAAGIPAAVRAPEPLPPPISRPVTRSKPRKTPSGTTPSGTAPPRTSQPRTPEASTPAADAASTPSTPDASATQPAIARASWRYLTYGTPVAATVGVCLWLVHFVPSGDRPPTPDADGNRLHRSGSGDRQRSLAPDIAPTVEPPSLESPALQQPTWNPNWNTAPERAGEGLPTGDRLTISPPQELRRRRD